MSTQARRVAKATALVASGALIGAGLGLLYAPKSGSETRRWIRHHAKRAQVEATKFSRKMKSGMDQAMERGKQLMAKRASQRTPEAA